MIYRRGRHAIKADHIKKLDSLEKTRSKVAEEAFRHKAYESISVLEYLKRLRKNNC